MKIEVLYGKILAFTKAIFLRKPQNGESLRSSFLIPSRGTHGPEGMDWWTSTRTNLLSLDVVQAAMKLNPNLANGDEETFQNLLSESIRENLKNPALFDFSKVLPAQVDTLFDAISPKSKNAFAQAFCDHFVRRCEGAIRDWLVAFPLVRIFCKTVSLGYDGLTLVASDDVTTWGNLASTYPDAGMFDLRNSRWFMDAASAPFLPDAPSGWLLCVVNGTMDGARRAAGKRMRTFVAVLFATAHRDYWLRFSKSGAEVSQYSVQFAASHGHGPNNRLASIGMIIPPVLNEWTIEERTLQEVKEWYRKRLCTSESIQSRATTATQFFHFGVIADEIERFIHMFIVLDTLFGERGKVESTILHGVSLVFPGHAVWQKKTGKLFDLRSEIVHGECSEIAEWEGQESYMREFESSVFQDVVTLAAFALLTRFDVQTARIPEQWYCALSRPFSRTLFKLAGWLNRL